MTFEPSDSQSQSKETKKTRIKIGNWIIYVWRRGKSAFFDWKLAEIDPKFQEEVTVLVGQCKKPGYEQAVKAATKAINSTIKVRQQLESQRVLSRIWLGDGKKESNT